MAPAAGHKGSALALLVDIMGGGVTGSSFSFEASGFSGNEGGPPDVGQVILAIDPGATPGDGFVDRLEIELAAMTAQPGVRLPGDRRLADREQAPSQRCRGSRRSDGDTRAVGYVGTSRKSMV